MAEMFDVSELVRIAVEDEKSGVAMYTALAGKARLARLKEAFADLTEQERYHQKRFEDMLQSMGDFKPPERYSGEYAGYLEALTADRAFPDAQAARRQAEACADDAGALALANRMERDTLLLLGEMRDLVAEKHRPVVDDIIEEERSHVVLLSEVAEALRS